MCTAHGSKAYVPFVFWSWDDECALAARASETEQAKGEIMGGRAERGWSETLLNCHSNLTFKKMPTGGGVRGGVLRHLKRKTEGRDRSA